MSKLETVTIALPREMTEDLRRAVEAGEFASPDEVIQFALHEWRAQRQISDHSVEELRTLVEEGIASGPGRFSSMDEIKAEARRRWQSTSA